MIARAKYGLGATLMIVLTACSVASKTETPAENLVVQGSDGPLEDVADESKPSPAKAPLALTATDRLMLEQAERSCKSGEVKSFLEAALRSKPVRLRYFIKPVKTAMGIRSVESYSFPFQIMDYNYVTAESVEKAPGDREYVQLDINQAQDERFRVDWIRIDFGKNGNDEGETPDDDKTYGPQGFLIFAPTAKCWTLVEDGVAG